MDNMVIQHTSMYKQDWLSQMDNIAIQQKNLKQEYLLAF